MKMKNDPDKEINTLSFILQKKDIYLAAAVLAAAFVLGLVFWYNNGRNKEEKAGVTLEITIDGRLYKSLPLSEDIETTVTTSHGSNMIVIEQGEAYIREADCPDKICAGMPRISQDGEMICCLPHRLFLTVKGGEHTEYDAVVY